MSIPTTSQRGSDRSPGFEHALVEDVMHPGIISCAHEADLVSVARAMATDHIHAVVVDGAGHADREPGSSWGLVSSLDLVAAALTGLDTADAGGVAATEVLTVTPDTPLLRAGQLMVEHQLAHLLVVSAAGEPVGVISTLDIAGCVAWGEM